MTEEKTTTEQKTGYEVSRLMPRHHVILDLVLTGMTNVEVAKAAGVTATTVAAVVNCPLGQAELSRRRNAIEMATNSGLASQVVLSKKVLDDASLQAATTMRTLLDDGDASIRFRSAKDILDRAAGMNNQGTTVVVVNADRLQNLMIAMRESRGQVADGNGTITIPSTVVG
jgi:hypothetical protein